ncbi:MAG: hypothetical protein ACK5ND_10960 [Bacteroides sp.]
MKKLDVMLEEDLGLTDERLLNLMECEGMVGYGAYLMLNHLLRHQEDYRFPLVLLSTLARKVHVRANFLMKIIKNYGLFVIDGEEFFSPSVTDFMLRLKIKKLTNKENKLQSGDAKKKSLSERSELKNVKKEIKETCNSLTDSRQISAYAGAKINNISIYKIREREKEKNNGQMPQRPMAAIPNSQQRVSRYAAWGEGFSRSTIDPCPDSIFEVAPSAVVRPAAVRSATAPSPAVRPATAVRPTAARPAPSRPTVRPTAASSKPSVPFSASEKPWRDWVDDLLDDEMYLRQVAMHSKMGRDFMKSVDRILELFKEHVELYGTSGGLVTRCDVKYYFSNFMREDSNTLKLLKKRLQDEQEARDARNPYRYEVHHDGRRFYPTGEEIPMDATPRPSNHSVFSEVSRRWVG